MHDEIVTELRRILVLMENEGPVWRPGTPFQQGMKLPDGYQMVFGTPRKVDAAATHPPEGEKKKKEPPKFVQPPPGTKGYATPEKLPDEPSKYFDVTPDSIMVPVGKLQTIRARPEGIANAEVLMANAYNGFNTKRKPISLKANADGTYTVLDGNSTTAIAAKHGWKNIVGKVVEGVTEETLADLAHDLRRLLRSEDMGAPEWKPGTPYEKGMSLPPGWRLAYGKYPYQPGRPATEKPSEGEKVTDAVEGLRKWIDAGQLSGTPEEHLKEAEEFLGKHAKGRAAFTEALKSIAPAGAEVSSRTKDVASAVGKISRKAEDAQKAGKKTQFKGVKDLGDGTGGRIICGSVSELQKTVEAIKKKFKVVEEDYAIESPKGGPNGMGYRGVHLDVIDADGLRKEIQLRTLNQHRHAEWAHDAYKPMTEEQRKARESNADVIDAYGRNASAHFYGVDSGQKTPPPKPDCPPIIKQTFGCL